MVTSVTMIHLTIQLEPLGERSPIVALTISDAEPSSMPAASRGMILK